eukprot:c17663_g1_i1.p1 GENE.c17663_g1_i1~~c17663_g1_i1.p1  ORF type:complete len:229 (-),score=57.10 c17663_g1_i1:103-789(-)
MAMAMCTMRKLHEVRILMVGLDGAGKTSLMYRMKTNENISTFQTLGFNVETVWKSPKNIVFTIWDVGGQERVRDLWQFYFEEKEAILFVVDSSARDRIGEAKQVLRSLMQEEKLRRCLLCVVANKQDISGCMDLKEVYYSLDLDSIVREKTIVGCSVSSGDNVLQVLDWFSENFRVKTGKERKAEARAAIKRKQEEDQAAIEKQRQLQEKARKKKAEQENSPVMEDEA